MAHPHTEDEDNLVPTDISCLPCPTPSPDRTPEPERAVVSMGHVWPSHEKSSGNIYCYLTIPTEVYCGDETSL